MSSKSFRRITGSNPGGRVTSETRLVEDDHWFRLEANFLHGERDEC